MDIDRLVSECKAQIARFPCYRANNRETSAGAG
jgi:hypothetical protein